MNRKLRYLPIILLLGWITQSQAQTTTPDAQKHDRFRHHDGAQNHDRFRGHNSFHRERIHYTADQRKQVMAINKDYQQKRADLFKQDNITLKQYKANLLALDKEKKDKMEALLTPQQKSEMASRKKKMDENRQVMEAGRLERLRLELNLTDDQVAQIKTGQLNLRNQMQAIHSNDNLLPEEKHQQVKALMTTRNDTYKTILTPDQFTKFQQMSRHRGFDRPGGPGGGPWQGRGGFDRRTT